MRSSRHISLGLLAIGLGAAPGAAVTFTEYNNDQAGWIAATGGDFVTLDFTGFPPGDSPIFDQYAELGVVFPDGSDFVNCDGGGYPLDGCGVRGGDPGGVITMQFDVPQFWIAAHFPGDIIFRLYGGDTLVYESSLMSGGVSDFAGVVASIAFDRAELTRDYEYGSADNIYFGGGSPVGDLDGDGDVDGGDLGVLLAAWGTAGAADLDGSGAVDGADLGVLLAAWTG